MYAILWESFCFNLDWNARIRHLTTCLHVSCELTFILLKH